jgi:hypothetical protein
MLKCNKLLSDFECCRLKAETRVESVWLQRLKLKCDELLSSSAFNVKLRRYATGAVGNIVIQLCAILKLRAVAVGALS